MGIIDQRSHIERKLYATAARDWCRSRSEGDGRVEYDGSHDQGDSHVRCLVPHLGPLDIHIGHEAVTAQCGAVRSTVADLGSERFDQLVFQARLDAFLEEVWPGAEPSRQDPPLVEGARVEVTLDRYERSRAAREACVAAHGAVCAICGFDFARAYGPDFAGIVQVHHVVPLHAVAEEHEVDPVRDLIPVCPNCHVALHSKPDGTYLPDELRRLMRE